MQQAAGGWRQAAGGGGGGDSCATARGSRLQVCVHAIPERIPEGAGCAPVTSAVRPLREAPLRASRAVLLYPRVTIVTDQDQGRPTLGGGAPFGQSSRPALRAPGHVKALAFRTPLPAQRPSRLPAPIDRSGSIPGAPLAAPALPACSTRACARCRRCQLVLGR